MKNLNRDRKSSAKIQDVKMKSDKVFFEILHNRLNGITSEMGHIIHKASFSPFIKEAWDFGQGLVSLSGEIFSYPRDIGVAFMVAALMDDALKAFDDYRPGDVVLMNDPYSSGGLCTHLPDIHLLKPYFYKDELVCFLWTFIHSSDVGGLAPGSIAPSAYDIFQEGLRVPPIKLYKEGVLNEDFVKVFMANSRIPDILWGDVQSLVLALGVAEKRLTETVEKYGLERVKNGFEDLLNYGEARARDVIREIPDGAYEFSDYIELDITGEPPSRIKLRLEVSGSDIHLDFSGTDPQVRAALNLPSFGKNHHFINAGVFDFIHAIDKTIPINRGVLRPVRVTIPPGTILNPEPPASLGVRFATGVRVMEVVMAALSLATDGAKQWKTGGIAPAAGSGLCGVILLALIDHRTGELKVNVIQPSWGGSGARPVKDGIDGSDLPAGFLRNIPVETSECEMPILVHKFQLVSENPSPGKFRGGLGIDLQFQVFSPNAILTARGMERFYFRPWGRKGGSYGTLTQTILNPGTNKETNVGKITTALQLKPKDIVRFITPNGGGYGAALERDPSKVLKDVKDELITVEHARDVYGVVITGGTVDKQATIDLRKNMTKSTSPAPDFQYGPEREEYESLFPQSLQDTLAKLLEQLPTSQRQFYRVRVWEEVTKHGKGVGTPMSGKELEEILKRSTSEVQGRL
jgi:N-methylhydantoinase B